MKNKFLLFLCLACTIPTATICDKKYSEFYNADLYSYAKKEVVTPAAPDTIENQYTTVSDTISHDYFTTSKTRTLIQQITVHGKTITSIETWFTTHPSYITPHNGIIASVITAAIIYSGIIVYDSMHATHTAKPQNTSETISYLFYEWAQLQYAQQPLSEEQQTRKNAIEIMPEFKQDLVNFSQKMNKPIDFNAPDDKQCSLCTQLREAYARTAEDNKIPHYFN